MAGFGTGLGLQGQPPLHGQYFNQRQQQEEARKNAKIKRDDDAYQRVLEETVIKPGEFDWKVETKAREAVADFTYQVNKLRQEHPNTWENMVPQLKQDTLGKLQGYRSDSVALKSIREAKKTGKYYVPGSLGKYMDTDQGNVKGGLPGLVDQKLGGIVVDQETGHIGYNPVEIRNIQGEIEKHITSKKDAFQDEIDPITKLPRVYTYKGPGGAVEYQTRRTLQPGQVDDLYAGITTDPHLSQNINIAYAEELKKRPDYNDAMIVTPDGQWNPEFLKGATKYGRDLAGNMARNYYTPNSIPLPAKGTTVNVNTGSTKLGGGVSAITAATFKGGLTTGELELDDKGLAITGKDGKPRMKYGNVDIESEAQFTTPNFQVQGAKTASVVDLLTGKKVDSPGVVDATYAPFAVVPIFKEGNSKGAAVPKEFSRNKKVVGLQRAIDAGEVEWKVVAIGSYEEPDPEYVDDNGKPIIIKRSIYQDANEVSPSAAAKLPEGDEPDFTQKLNTQYEFASAKNNGYRGNFEKWQTDGKPKGAKTGSGQAAPKTGGKPKIQGF